MATTSPAEGGPGGARARQRAEARARLLRAAKEVFEEKGFLDVRVADIAGRAGVSHGLFYHYFDSKKEIFGELAAVVDRELTDTIDVMLDRSSGTTPYERLRTSVRVHFERYRNEARMMAVIEEVSRYDDSVRAARKTLHATERERIVRAIRQLQEHDLADRRLDPEIAAVAIEALTWNFAERWLVRGELDCDFDTCVDQFFIMLTNTLQIKKGPGSHKKLPGGRTRSRT
ncbi:TetR/AcrR family transcriptional regulator [Streptomyces sp. NPDC048251]|uniref:TetR/AcrR family transcriptional regulator n=1 Tax=Streptomyces sp. NPDC048251 TaxID=3154501 RepID=UPI00343083C2